MKGYTLIFLLSSFIYTCRGQDTATADSTQYAVAYNYILNDSIGMAHTLIPSNQLVGTSYMWFSDSLEFSNNNEIKNLTPEDYQIIPSELNLSEEQQKKLIRNYKAARYDEYRVNGDSIFLSYTFPRSVRLSGRASYKLYFSPIYCNEFFVNLNMNGFTWGNSYIYFFIFDNDNTIKKVYSTFVEYN